MGSLGRYSNGSSQADRSLFLELYNTPQKYIKDLKKRIYEEKNNSGDGLCQRFLMCALHPLFGLKKKNKKGSAKPKISILCILYAIEQIFSKDKIIFKFDNDAQEVYEVIADEYGTICELAHNIDGFIA